MKKMRLENYDYSMAGYYFVTFVTKNRECYFGKIENEKLILNEIGKIAYNSWINIPEHYDSVEIDEFIIMPDHIHGIIIINDNTKNNKTINTVGVGQCPTPTVLMTENRIDTNYGLLSKIINSYKNIVTKTIREKYPDTFFNWQRSFYDHIIRKNESLDRIRNYIKYNYLKEYDNDFDEFIISNSI
jgi:putative transposase